MSLASVLRDIQKRRSDSSGIRRNLVIFDLDSTLFDLTLRVSAIVDRFALDPANRLRFPVECAKLADIKIERTDWGLIKPLSRIGLTPNQNGPFVSALQSAWVGGFFSNDFLDRDFALPGAVKFVEQCLDAGADVLYLTGRDVPRMGVGTESSLIKSGFPLNGISARLHLKPEASLDDAQFKADVIEGLVPQYGGVWLFENEPVNINAVLRRTPNVNIVFIETCHSGLEIIPPVRARIQHFEVELTELE